MTIARVRSENAPAGRFSIEPFKVVAERELAAASLIVPGECFNPACARRFEPSRSWQVYCCDACARAGEAEARRWGARVALPLLAWRVGKYESPDSPSGALVRAARRYITRAQTEWLKERNYLRAAAVAQNMEV